MAANHTGTVHEVKNPRNGSKRYYCHCSCGWTSSETKSVEKLERLLLSTHPKLFVKTCPTPTKRSYKSEQAALEGMRSFWATRRGVRMPCRAYKCECNKWHTTSKPLRESRRALSQDCVMA